MGKPDGQTGRIPTRFPSRESGRGSAIAEDERQAGDDAFYRPRGNKTPDSSAARPFPGDFPFRDKTGDDLDEDAPFLRSSRRVPVRRGILPRGRWGRIGFAAGALALTSLTVWLGFAVRDFAAHDPRFRIDSSDNVQILGNSEVTQAELLSVFGGDMGRNVFFIPLKERRTELEGLPWVETATVMRLLPDQLRVSVTERTPVAFVRTGNQIGLVDKDGVLLPMDPKTLTAKHYSFPVLSGITATDPASTRAARMEIYARFLADLDSSGERLSGQLSEVDLSDPEDIKALVPFDNGGGGSDLLLHLGDKDFLPRWRNYQQHLAEWKAQYPRLASVDLRYERQVVLEMQKGASTTPGQDAAGRTMDDLKADARSISPIAAKQMAVAANRKAAGKSTVAAKKRSAGRTAQSRYVAANPQQGRN